MVNKGEISGKSEKVISRTSAVIFLLFVFTLKAHTQDLAPSIEFDPRRYVSVKSSDSLNIDGKLEESSWKNASWSEPFVDIEGEAKAKPRFDTRVKMLWDEQYFYIAATLEEPHLWATLDERDSIIFHENNFEVFIDPDGDTHNYYELEVNALGTFWDLMLTKPYRDNGRAIDAWDIRGLKVGIDLNGTLNNSSDRDSGWTVELAIPWEVLEEAAPEGRPPKDGELWRVNFSRVQWQIDSEDGTYVKQSDTEDNWSWSPQGLINMHYPEMWGFVHFSEDNTDGKQLTEDAFGKQPNEQIKWYLRHLYYRQHEYRDENGGYSSELVEIKQKKLQEEMSIDFDQWSELELHATDHTFEISIEHSETENRWYIREDGRIWQN